jgi:hypothetical protein
MALRSLTAVSQNEKQKSTTSVAPHRRANRRASGVSAWLNSPTTTTSGRGRIISPAAVSQAIRSSVRAASPSS